jgi:uncharacterized protein (DUF58 family)
MRRLQNARQRLTERAAAWAMRRQGADHLPLRLMSRRLYILPTRTGVGFGVMLFGMLLAGLNYANSLALLFTFMLAGLALVAMHQCHRNLLGLLVTEAGTTAAFAGSVGRLSFVLENTARAARPGIELQFGEQSRTSCNLGARASARCELSIAAPRRGRIRIDRVKVSSAYPFGLFRAWTWVHLPLALLVYPATRGTHRAPHGAAGRTGRSSQHEPGEDEWAGLRDFRDGDSSRQVAWKVYARGLPLLVKEYSAEAGATHEFSFASLPGVDPETRLEQLARWIVDADARGERYALVLPGRIVELGGGVAHRERCLAALAVFGLPADDPPPAGARRGNAP